MSPKFHPIRHMFTILSPNPLFMIVSPNPNPRKRYIQATRLAGQRNNDYFIKTYSRMTCASGSLGRQTCNTVSRLGASSSNIIHLSNELIEATVSRVERILSTPLLVFGVSSDRSKDSRQKAF